MRRFVTSALMLLGTLSAASSIAHADETLQLTAPSEAPSPHFTVQGIGTGLLGGSTPLVGVELGLRTSPSFELQLEYSQLVGDGGDESVGVLGTGFRWLSPGSTISPYFYGGAAMLILDGDPIPEVPILRTGFGAEMAAPSGFFMSVQAGIDLAATAPDAITADARLGVGFHF